MVLGTYETRMHHALKFARIQVAFRHSNKVHTKAAKNVCAKGLCECQKHIHWLSYMIDAIENNDLFIDQDVE
jgi:hypothetical protein